MMHNNVPILSLITREQVCSCIMIFWGGGGGGGGGGLVKIEI